MVAVIEPAVSSKSSPATVRGLSLEPVRSGGESLWFGPGRHVIGSSTDCSHNLRTAGVQPRHCEIRLEAGHATLRALDFRTWLNNGPVRQAELRSGDRLIVGPLEFRVHVDAESTAQRPRKSAATPANLPRIRHQPPLPRRSSLRSVPVHASAPVFGMTTAALLPRPQSPIPISSFKLAARRRWKSV